MTARPWWDRAPWAALAFAVYAGAIVLSNVLITHVGVPAGPGTHLTPVGFGLLAPSGVWAAAVSFPARDVVQRLTPRWHGVPVVGILAILIGAAISYKISAPAVAIASGGTYLCSESLDCAIYTPLQKRHFVAAVGLSCTGAALLDSWVFLHWPAFPHWQHLPAGWHSMLGLIVGKLWVIAVGTGITWWLRNAGPLRVQAVTA